MYKYIRTILIQITNYGMVVLLVGLGFLCYALYTQYKAFDDHAFTARDKLQTLSGKVLKATEVTVTSTRRRGGSRVSDRYYEISVKPTAGEANDLRFPLSVGKSRVESVIDEEVTALFDADDNNIVYDLQMGGKPVLTFEETRDRLQKAASLSAKANRDFLGIGISILLALIGAAAMWWNRRMIQQQRLESTVVSNAT